MTQAEAFGAVCEALGWRPEDVTGSARARIGKVAKELREVGATIDMIEYAPIAWQRMWANSTDQVTLTDTAITAWWPEIRRRYEQHENRRARQAEAAARAGNQLAAVDFLSERERKENLKRVREMLDRLNNKGGDAA